MRHIDEDIHELNRKRRPSAGAPRVMVIPRFTILKRLRWWRARAGWRLVLLFWDALAALAELVFLPRAAEWLADRAAKVWRARL